MKKISGLYIFVGIVIAAVLAVIVYGFILTGAPSQERDRQLDQRRISDLQQISSGLDQYYAQYKIVPDVLDNRLSQFYAPSLADPKTGVPYEYKKTSDTAYQLCAIFSYPSQEENRGPKVMPMYGDVWHHDAGRYCYGLQVQQAVVPRPPAAGIKSSCVLMKNKGSGQIDCFGCANGICKDSPGGFEMYVATSTPGAVGIPYSCFPSEQGCSLAQ